MKRGEAVENLDRIRGMSDEEHYDQCRVDQEGCYSCLWLAETAAANGTGAGSKNNKQKIGERSTWLVSM
ncbi:hypothetical protein [Brevibacillus formosus]|uniref:hypothetical protein n=1 Tax=Brevibacillus formosus TaxID=54913 RepID=UPI003F1DE9C5